MSDARAGRRIWKAATETSAGQLLVALVVVVVCFSALYPQFFTADNGRNMSRDAAVLLIVAIGQMAVLLVGGFDISVGATMGFASVIAGKVMLAHGLWPGVLAGIGAAAGVGLVNGLLVAKARVSPFITTLGMLTFLTGATNQITGGQSLYGFPSGFRNFGAADLGAVPSTVVIAAGVVVVSWALLTRTRPGLYVYAIGGSREASTLAGIRVGRYETGAYVFCSALAGLAGIMLASRVSVAQQSIGQGYELLSIATAVMGGVAIGGGVGGITGVLLGVSLLTCLTTGLNIAGASSFVQQMFTGFVVVAAVVLAQARSAAGSAVRALWRIGTATRSRPAASGAPLEEELMPTHQTEVTPR